MVADRALGSSPERMQNAFAKAREKISKIACSLASSLADEDAGDLLSIKRQLENYLRYFISKSFLGYPANLNAKHSRRNFKFHRSI